MERYNVTGMSCAACSARVEKAVLKVEGVEKCAVNLLTNSMNVWGTASSTDIISAVEEAGYGASLKGAEKTETAENTLEDKETPILKKRLVYSLGFLVVLLYFSMGHSMWGFPLPPFFNGNYIAIGLVQLLLTVIIMTINQKFFVSGFKSLFHGSPNMDTLVALGSASAFVYSTYILFAMTGTVNNSEMLMHYSHEFYFESSAMILTLITVGKMLEARSKGKTTDAIKSLIDLSPKTAVIISDGKEKRVPVGDVNVGDIFVVRPGESIPVDGVITEGTTAVDESALTGESIPIDKGTEDNVSAATINISGFIKCRAVRVGQDTALSKIIQLVSDAAADKAPIAKTADKVSGIFVPVVICIALVSGLVWLLVGQTVGFALARAISVLVISCPCALGLATPVAIMVGSGVGAKNGIMFKTAAILEQSGKTQIVVLDKTGTITKGKPVVTDICPEKGVTEKELLECAYSLEKMSEHPLSKAIVNYSEEKGISSFGIDDFQAVFGKGLKGKKGKDMYYGGNYAYISTFAKGSEEKGKKLSEEGKTPLYFAKGNKMLGIIAVADVIKPEAPEAVKKLKDMGIEVIMLTGDNERTANAIGKVAGVDRVIAQVLPDGKEKVIRELKQKGRVAMVGDGINDAPALTAADTGIAIGSGTDIAVEAADIVLMRSRLTDVPDAIDLSRDVLKNIHQNLFWAFFYNVIGIPLAAGLWIPILHWQLNPMFGAAAMSLSSFCVVTNALRLNFHKFTEIRDKENNIVKEEQKTMNKTMKIQGMMCEHCQARVKKCLEALENVTEADVSFKEGTAVVKLSADVSSDVLKSTVEEQGYEVVSVE